MSHQPFENYLVSGTVLDAEQQHQLDLHLKDCEGCHSLSLALTGIDDLLSTSPSPVPAPGFTQRWQAQLVSRRQTHQNRNFWVLSLGMIALAALILLIIFLINIFQLNWAYELTQVIARISVIAGQTRHYFNLSRRLINTLPILIPLLALGFSGACLAASALIFTWYRTIIKLYSPKYKRGNQS
jgi:hypothetical protein